MKKAPLRRGLFLYPRLPGNTIAAGPYFGSSETEVEPTYLADFLWTPGNYPFAQFKIIRPPRAGAGVRHEQYQKDSRKSDITPLHAALGAKSTFSIIFMQKERA